MTATPPPAPTAAEQAQPVMVVPKSIYRAFHGKEQEAWLHGYRAAFERYATPVPDQAQPAGVTEDERDAARYRWIARADHFKVDRMLDDAENKRDLDAAIDAARAQEGEKP